MACKFIPQCIHLFFNKKTNKQTTKKNSVLKGLLLEKIDFV